MCASNEEVKHNAPNAPAVTDTPTRGTSWLAYVMTVPYFQVITGYLSFPSSVGQLFCCNDLADPVGALLWLVDLCLFIRKQGDKHGTLTNTHSTFGRVHRAVVIV